VRKIFSMKQQILDYDTSKYRFQEWACDVLGISSLENAHASDKVKLLNKSPTSNQLVNSFEDIFDNYCLFISDIIIGKIGKIDSYQSPPSFRFHYCGRGSSVFHKDRDFGVEDGRLNVWVPLTNVWGSNSLWIENQVGTKDFEPLKMQPGQALVFDGVNREHGSKINTTSTSRISFDFRFMPGPGPAVPASY